jgi:broad specificity phosphatase PhoE
MPRLRLPLLCVLLALLPVTSGSQPLPGKPAWINDMLMGGYVIVLRHGPTIANDIPGGEQLSAEGRAQAQSIGESMRKLDIPVHMVVTSTVQRAADSAMLLGFYPVTANPDLAEGVSLDERNRHALAFRNLVTTPPPLDVNVVIVSHQQNIVDAFGEDWRDVREGEASVFQPDWRGGYRLIGRIQPNDWPR